MQYGNKAVFLIVGDGPNLNQLKRELGNDAYFTGFLEGEQLSKLMLLPMRLSSHQPLKLLVMLFLKLCVQDCRNRS